MLKTLFEISFRNLIRQKRRSLLLGIAIAFGAMILVVANSFSRGISDTLFNQIVEYVSGHISINFAERGNFFRQIFYDAERINTIVDETIPDIKSKEESIGVFGRGIGNGKADNIILVGFNLDADIGEEEIEKAEQNFKMIEGSFDDLKDTTVENPLIIAEKKADYLNLKVGDVLKARFTNARGQDQAARFTLVGIFKPANIFMSFPVFSENRYLKPLMGYGKNHTAPVYINIHNPRKYAAAYADSLHAKLQPRKAIIPARLKGNNRSALLPIMGFKDDSASSLIIDSALGLEKDTDIKEGFYINTIAAETFNIKEGDKVTYSFIAKYDSAVVEGAFTVSKIVQIPEISHPLALINPTDFYRRFYPQWPRDDAQLREQVTLTDSTHPLFTAIAPEWELMARSRSTKETQQRFRDMAKLKSKAVIMDVRSMYETASAVLKLEGALNLITVIAVLVLFFIILIGVINTLRMSIKERTREIGTIRAIGMQRFHVRRLFVIETTLLAFIASVVGSMGAFIVMWLLKQPTIDAGENPMGMLLVNGHLHFAPSAVSIILFIAIICAITAVTAFFPARGAANMHPSHALRHFE